MSATALVIVTGSIIGLTVYCTRRYYSGAIKAKKGNVDLLHCAP